jgi:hypothetical protein
MIKVKGEDPTNKIQRTQSGTTIEDEFGKGNIHSDYSPKIHH